MGWPLATPASGQLNLTEATCTLHCVPEPPVFMWPVIRQLMLLYVMASASAADNV